jgi:hypothetical protein
LLTDEEKKNYICLSGIQHRLTVLMRLHSFEKLQVGRDDIFVIQEQSQDTVSKFKYRTHTNISELLLCIDTRLLSHFVTNADKIPV